MQNVINKAKGYFFKKLIVITNNIYVLYTDVVLFNKTYYSANHFFCSFFIYNMFQLNNKTHYYIILFTSMTFYFLFSKCLTKLWPLLITTEHTTFLQLNAIRQFKKSLIYISMLWFPMAIFLNQYFCIITKIWFLMLNLVTGYVWFFFGCFFFCYFSCGITYHLIMTGWHKQLYFWVIIYAFFLYWLYTLPFFLENSLFADIMSNYIFEKSRYIFIAWSGISYLTGWLWYRKYIQKTFSHYNKIPYAISLGNLIIMLLFDLYLNIFNFPNWLFTWTTYIAIAIWFLLNNFSNFRLDMFDDKPCLFFKHAYFKFFRKINFWNHIPIFIKNHYLYFFKKMSLFYWIWIFHFFLFSKPLTNFEQWKWIVPFFLNFFFIILCLSINLVFFLAILKKKFVKKDRAFFYGKKKIIYFILPHLIVWGTAFLFIIWSFKLNNNFIFIKDLSLFIFNTIFTLL